ncbi:TPA: acyltransferase [Vibrio vulnificus]|nr:acyltransferase [Vibrio vulnificus]HDY8106561.1 acyltransferase [Vibrio vulnificus]HDY8208270.1 acyltransferase [Vibrio vulnificus]
MILKDIYNKIKFCKKADRIGPDMPFTHWMLHYKSTMYNLCSKKFKIFSENSDFRPGAYAVACSNISIGKNVVIRPGSMIFADEYAEVIIHDNVMIGSGVHFYVNNHKFENRNIPLIEQGYYPSESIIIKDGSWIGANSIILPGVTIGKNCVVGAGSIVTKSIPDYCVVVGNPARIIKSIP